MFIRENLESIKAQTYQNIELILSDDGSNDNTTDICREWLKANEKRFVRTCLITVKKNTGTSANCNRGWQCSNGEWVKLIAGDDRLLPNCISDNVSFIKEHSNAQIVFSMVRGLGNEEAAARWYWKDVGPFFKGMTDRQISIMLFEGNFLPAGSAWVKRTCIEQLGGYDESIVLIEDWPFWMKAMSKGIKFWFLDKETVEYRFSDCSISQDNKSASFQEDEIRASELGRSYLRQMGIGSQFFDWTRVHRYDNIMMRFCYTLNIFNPFYYEHKRCRRLFTKILEMNK